MKATTILGAIFSLLGGLVSIGQDRNKDAFTPVQQAVRERSRSAVAWLRDQQARQQTLEDVRRLLGAPLTPAAAAQRPQSRAP